MNLEDFGYTIELAAYRRKQNLETFDIGRIILEHKDRYIVKTVDGDLDGELIGNLRYTAESKFDLPAVGDWVAISEYDENKALIHAVYPRHSILERQRAGKSTEPQIIATNIDYGLIVQSVNRDFNMNRLERYLTICNASKVAPIIVLSKTDLINDKTLQVLLGEIKDRIKDVSVIPISNQSGQGLNKLEAIVVPGKTYCLLGSSGVGKSTLLNKLSQTELMPTCEISARIDRGKHMTTHRELFVLENGGIFIDNPGMREIGMTNTMAGLETTFDTILLLAQNCRFKNCSHINEAGCAIRSAIEIGEIDEESYANFIKMEKEQNFFESSLADKKKKDKDLGKLIKSVKRIRKQHKF